jgi:hypothetical protein
MTAKLYHLDEIRAKKQKEELDPNEDFLLAQFEHSTELYHRRQKANYEVLENDRKT